MMYGIASLRCTLRGGVCVSSTHTVGASHVRWTSVLNSQALTLEKSASNKETVSIPKRIRRSPTAILEALKSTVLNRQGNPHYKFHDDPYLIPQSNLAKRVYALSRESGKKSAKWIRDNYPAAFNFNIAEPNIEKFAPKLKIEKQDATEDLLKHFLAAADVSSANTVYEMLSSEGKSINDQTKQAYLELLCFYNCRDSTDEDLLEEKWYKQTPGKDNRNMWMDNNIAENLFEELKVKDEKAYTAMLCGTAKFFKGEKAFDYYNKMKELQLPVSRVAYSYLLKCTSFVRETSDSRWQLIEELLQNMNADGIAPDLDTMNSVLEAIVRLGGWKNAKKLALATMSEMKHLGIEPSLYTYNSLLRIFCREKGPVSTILYDIIDILSETELTIRDPRDVHFFTMAMEICHLHVNDYQLAYEVDKLLNSKDNYRLIGDSVNESFYYQHFFKLLCAQETIQNIFEIYNKLVPHVSYYFIKYENVVNVSR
ncbi:hypothetical protein CHUAL_009685 [Chamberlinius hualienensis]